MNFSVSIVRNNNDSRQYLLGKSMSHGSIFEKVVLPIDNFESIYKCEHTCWANTH